LLHASGWLSRCGGENNVSDIRGRILLHPLDLTASVFSTKAPPALPVTVLPWSVVGECLD
jgi:hypothetical protein